MMAERLVELHRVLKPTGSIYLHCDPTASHYIKILLDSIFGRNNFRNEIAWCYSIGGKSRKTFGRKHDVIFFYTKSDEWTFNLDSPFARISRKPDSHMKVFVDEEGITWQEKTDKHSGKVYRYPFDKVADDYWLNIEQLNREDAERLGYPTQKPEALLERIIDTSSNIGGIVLDPFCGCGTAIAVAEKLHRRWIGVDITHLAITLMRHRLHDSFPKDLSPYEIIGQPKDLESARDLAQESEHSGRYQFEWWALGLIDARPAQDKKKGSDKGIDGYINFFDDNSGKAKTIIVQVKSGHVSSSHIRDLKGVLEREKAQIGVYITLEEPTKPMKEEAASAGFYEPEFFQGNFYPKIQILTIKELLDGKKAEYPRHAPEATFKRAQRTRKDNGEEQNRLL